MFNPKITKQTIQDFILDSSGCSIEGQVELRKAIVALPELLEVYKAAQICFDNLVIENGECSINLWVAINKL